MTIVKRLSGSFIQTCRNDYWLTVSVLGELAYEFESVSADDTWTVYNFRD